MSEYRCVEYTCGWQGREPAWEDRDTMPDVPLCPRCDGEVEELIGPGQARKVLAANETFHAPIEERREALLDYLAAAVTWRADHRLQVGLDDVSLRTMLKGLAGDAALVPSWLCDDLGLIYGMTSGELAAWIKDRLA
jgi:hypothetical protein